MKGIIPGDGTKKTAAEQIYEQSLIASLSHGNILGLRFDCINLKLGSRSHKTGFLVLKHDFSLEFHLVKHKWNDGQLKKVALLSKIYPFTFVVMQQRDGRTQRFHKEPSGRARIPITRNKLELDYGKRLIGLQHIGDIAWFGFELINLRLAKDTFYNPDYFVLTKDGRIEVHEVKGFWQDDARVKFKVAASLFPFQFIAATKSAGNWQFEYIK